MADSALADTSTNSGLLVCRCRLDQSRSSVRVNSTSTLIMTDSNSELDDIPFDLTDTDRANLAGGDENFHPHDWEDLKRIIGGTRRFLDTIDSLPFPLSCSGQ